METVQVNIEDATKEDVSAEGVLFDVLDQIFSYLSIKDLCRVAPVCRSWLHIANLEIIKRNNIESLIWPITDDSDTDDSHDDDRSKDYIKSKYLKNKWHISDSMRSLPKLVLLFNDSNETELRNIEQFFVYHWSRVKIGTKIGAFQSLAIFMNNTEIVTNSNLGIAITLPLTPKIKCAAYSPNDLELQMHAKNNTIAQLAGQAVNRLLFTEDSHNCFVIFKNEGSEIKDNDLLYSRTFLTEFVNNLKQRCEPGTYSIWGGGVPLFITNVDNLGINSFVWFFIARISGPVFNSWSIVLQTDQSDMEQEEILADFKSKIHFKSNTIALAMTSSKKNETSEERLSKTKIFRKIFPKISVVTIYEEDGFIQLGMNTINCDTNPQVEHTKSVAYLIMTTE